MSLYKLKCSNSCTIEKVPTGGLLNSLGVREGLSVLIKSKQPFGGPVVIQIGSRCIAIAKDLAENIMVKEVS